jgi:tetratricopeptide (TPR) repeat protein
MRALTEVPMEMSKARRNSLAGLAGAVVLAGLLLPRYVRTQEEGEYRVAVEQEIRLIDQMRDGLPWNGNTYEQLAEFHKRHGHWAEAAVCYTNAAELGDGLFNPYGMRAECYEKLGRAEDAARDRLTARNWSVTRGRLKTTDELADEKAREDRAKGVTVFDGRAGSRP